MTSFTGAATRGSHTAPVPPVSIMSCVNAASPNSGCTSRISAEWCGMAKRFGPPVPMWKTLRE